MSTEQAPTSRSTPKQFDARVNLVRELCEDHFEIVLECEDAGDFAPGRFLQITSRPDQLDPPSLHTHLWPADSLPQLDATDLQGRRPLLRRPYSPADAWREPDGAWRISLIVRVVGPGTASLARRKVGDRLEVIGPIGNRFDIPAACRRLLLVAGGTGVAPMIFLARHLRRTRGADAPRMLAFFGAAARRVLCVDIDETQDPACIETPAECIRQFAEADVPALLSTDDGSIGLQGFVTDLTDAWIDHHQPEPAETLLCVVGPEPMMAAAVAMAAKWNLPVQVSLERKMGCGLGTCQSCVVPILTGDGDAWEYKLTCKDGPIFDGKQVVWGT